MCEVCRENDLKPRIESLPRDLLRWGGGGVVWGLFMFLPGGPIAALGRSVLIGVVGWGGSMLLWERFMRSRTKKRAREIVKVFYPEYCRTGAVFLASHDAEKFSDLYRLAVSQTFRKYYNEARGHRKAQAIIRNLQIQIDTLAKRIAELKERERSVNSEKGRSRILEMERELDLEREIYNELTRISEEEGGDE